ncbi:MAG TPA: hemolysin [Brevundimonas sp.]|uniref:hemolysin n=1 Tax=Brevundimonas sp. TaxID=1871086 RepID=UPI002D1A6B20|nr:hemolysin [Brevundimonas sp.]HRH19742.1 hemolysin [Brevundimonas sp.]
MKQILLMSSLALAAACAPVPPPHQIGGPDPIPPENDRCRASVRQDLIGRHRSEIPTTPPGAIWRVSCSSCAVTMDYNPQRLNIVYDDRTEIIQSVSCG